MLKTHRLAALAALVIVGAVTPANAVPVTYATSGVFGSSGTSTLSLGGVPVIEFVGASLRTVNVDPVTNANFGGFRTAATLPAGTYTLVDTFTLTISQSAPLPGGTAVFATPPEGVSGTIVISSDPAAGNRSTAFIMFGSPLSRTIPGTASDVTYRLVEADGGTARVEIFPTPGDTSVINGQISGAVVATPEPGTMALACLALPLLGLGYVRRRRRQAAS